MQVLVTGATGLLGNVLVKRLKSRYAVTGVSLSGRGDTVACDLKDERAVGVLFKGRAFTGVIHAAAYSDVDGCERDPKRAHETNALGTRHLAAVCRDQKVPFIYVSTDYVFDGHCKDVYDEEDTTFPVNIYGLTKLEGEHHTRALAWRSAIVRTSWLFGAGVQRNFVNAIIERLKTENVVRVLADQRDCPTYAKDLAEALEKILNGLMRARGSASEAGRCEVYHFCNGGATTRLEMTRELKKLLGKRDVRVEETAPSEIQGRLAVRPEHPVLSTHRFEKQFGVKPRPWQEALKEYVKEQTVCAF